MARRKESLFPPPSVQQHLVSQQSFKKYEIFHTSARHSRKYAVAAAFAEAPRLYLFRGFLLRTVPPPPDR